MGGVGMHNYDRRAKTSAQVRSLQGMLDDAFESWANAVGERWLANSQGYTFLGAKIDGRVAIVAFKGARGNLIELHMSYDIPSGYVHGAILGNIEGHKIQGLKFKYSMYDHPDRIATGAATVLGNYIEENGL